jgi:hypothetical protein
MHQNDGRSRPGDLHILGVTLKLYPVLMDLPKLPSQLRTKICFKDRYALTLLPDDSLV